MKKHLSKTILQFSKGLSVAFLFCFIFSNCLCVTTHIITAQGMTFSPNNVNCVVGDTIKFEWVNGTHTTTSTSVPTGAATWSQNLNSGSQTYKYVITKAGTYHYQCNYHYLMGMTGTLNATAALSATITPFTNVSCTGGSNGSATASPAGGTSPYTYSWSPGGQTTATISGLTTGTYTVTVTDAASATATASVTISQPASLPGITIASQTNVDCHGNSTGNATASAATGGTSPYTYAWTPSGGTNLTASNLAANTYTITVTDNHGCTATASVIISQPSSSLGITINSHTNVNCNGNSTGSATANAATGGSSPYTYAWAPGGGTSLSASNLSANTYTLTATDNHGCTATAPVNVTQPAVLIANASISANVSCNGGSNGSAVSSPSGGTSPYTYSWSGGKTNSSISSLSIGTYTIGLTDINGCSASASVTITQPTAINDSIKTINSLKCVCEKTAIVFPYGGTSPYTYQWSNSVTKDTDLNLTGGNTYTVTITDANGCIHVDSVTIPNQTFHLTTTQTNILCNGSNTGSAGVVSPSGPGYHYAWSPGGQTTASIFGLSAGTYSITVTDSIPTCKQNAVFTITEPPPLVGSIYFLSNNYSASDVCGDTACISAEPQATGGVPPYTFSSFLPFTICNTVQTIITVTDSNGCTNNIVVYLPMGLSIRVQINNNVTCNGGTNGSATVNEQTGPQFPSSLSYNWSPGGGTNQTESNLGAGTYTVTVRDPFTNCSVQEIVAITEPPVISLTTTVTPVTCAGGGSATASVTGGVSPYTYLWSDANSQTNATAVNLASGSYTVTLTDFNGCTKTSSAFINITSGISVSANTTANVSCNGGNNGSASANVSGGTTPYTYLWSDGNSQTTVNASGLITGIYTVSVKDLNGCTGSATVNISQPNQLSVISSQLSAISCYGGNNGSASSTITGGTSPYTYTWSNGGSTSAISALSMGTYTLTVHDSCGASSTASINITQPNQLIVSANTTNNVRCYNSNDGSASSTVSGGTSPYTYSWSNSDTSPNISSLSAGTYTLNVTDHNGCTGSASAVITQPNAITISGDSVNDNGSCDGKAWAIVGGGTNPYAYLWTGGGTTDTIKNKCFGSYCCVVTDANGCKDSVCVTINLATGTDEMKGESEKVKVYPNPNNGEFTITNYELGIMNIEIYNVLGQQVYSQFTIYHLPFTIDLSSNPNGVYFYRVTGQDGRLLGEGKIIIEK